MTTPCCVFFCATVAAGYLTFYLAEGTDLHVSGVLATVAIGLCFSAVGTSALGCSARFCTHGDDDLQAKRTFPAGWTYISTTSGRCWNTWPTPSSSPCPGSSLHNKLSSPTRTTSLPRCCQFFVLWAGLTWQLAGLGLALSPVPLATPCAPAGSLVSSKLARAFDQEVP